MARQYPQEFHERIVALARSGRPVSELRSEYGVADATIYHWLDRDRIEPGVTSTRWSVRRDLSGD